MKNGVGYNEENQETAVVPLNADTLQGLSASAFAPAGYGLGEPIYCHAGDGVLEFFDEQLATMLNGTTKFIEFAGDYQYTGGSLFTGKLCKRDNDYAYVIGYTYTDAMGLYRAKYNGVWQPWEWINPPMKPDVEYRTTERFNGKPVYTKVITYINSEIGSSNGVTDVEIPHNISDFNSIVRCNATCSGTFTLPYMYGANSNTSVYQVTATNIVMRIINDIWHSGVFVFTIHYTKA